MGRSAKGCVKDRSFVLNKRSDGNPTNVMFNRFAATFCGTKKLE